MALNVLETIQSVEAELSAETPAEAPSAPAETAGSPVETSAAPATQEATAETPAPATEKPKGPIPYERHEAVLKNTREEYEQKLARFKDIDPDAWRERLAAFEAAERDPVSFLRAFEQRLRTDPQYASHFTPAPPAVAAPADPMPEPDLEFQDGTLGYSAKQQVALLDWRDRERERKAAEKQREVETQRTHVFREAATELQTARAEWEGFSQYEPEVAAYLAKDGRATLHSAYIKVVVPKLKADRAQVEKEAREKLIAEMQSKPRANTEVPSGGTGGAAKNFAKMSVSDIVAETMRELAGS